MILGELSEARREEAIALVAKFGREEQVAVAEVLADAEIAGKFEEVARRLKLVVDDLHVFRTLQTMYDEFTLKPKPRS